MGTILRERVPQQHCLERTTERGGKKKPPWSSSSRPNVVSNKMGRRQSQRKSPQPKQALPNQESHHEKRFQQRKKHKTNTPSTKCHISQHSAQGTLVPKLRASRPPADDEMEQEAQPAAQCCSYKEQKHRHGAASAGRRRRHRQPRDASPDLLERRSSNPEAGQLSSHVDGDSDTDLSESERRPESPSSRVPPQLELRPEVIEAEDLSPRGRRPKGRGHGEFDFPDFLPPPFNSWSLSQLAVFYNMEGRTVPRPRPVGPLERYLERLLQLEWRQIQNVQEDSGKTAAPEVVSGCHRSAASASSRLSSPKCILQCQRAFHLTFLSSLASHSALLSGCACTLCRMRYSTCGVPCGRSAHSHTRQSRLSPMLERRGPVSLPKRSYSESRAHCSAQRAPRFSSPVRANSHMRRMQALGNIRNPVQGANTKPHSARDSTAEAGGDWVLPRVGEVLDDRTGGVRRRSGSEQRKSPAERRQEASQRCRSGSECRRGGSERRRAAELKEREIKPDAVTAIMDNLPGSRIRYPHGNKPNRPKQVDFVT